MKYQEIINKMTLEEKARMMSGRDTWSTVEFEKYGIPAMFLSDGPHGIRRQLGAADHLGLNESAPATCFPTAATVANSWDEDLGEELGTCLGEEAVSLGVNVVLGPGLNVKRSPLCGRNFEYFSEDPYLAGKMAAGYIRGIQSQGISACPKHFAANNQELRRMSSDSVVDERTFRELYTTNFEIAVKEGKAKSIMTAYNQINGVYANEDEHLLQDILVKEWGFDGFVVSDWGGSNDHVRGVEAGSHLEMPSTGRVGEKEIVAAVRAGKLKEEMLNQRLDELLTVIFDTHEATKAANGGKFEIERHHEVARKAARESIVLLKNDANILPIAKGKTVAIIGDFAETPRYQGAGSSLVNPTKLEKPVDVYKESGLVVTAFAKGYERSQKPNAQLFTEAIEAAKKSEIAIIYAGLDEISESEGLDRTHMKMPQNQIDIIKAVSEVNPNVIVVLAAGSAIEMPWISNVKAVVHGYLCGQAGASAMVDVLTGAFNPCGKLNETYPLRYEDTPNFGYFPSKERSSEYRESIYVGYRYYSTVDKKVLFPFGYGLSYTKFEYMGLQISENGVTVEVKNVGDCDGKEIVQLYVGKKSDMIFRPARELKGFKKVFIKAGESKKVEIPFDDKTFRYYNVKTNGWEIEGGKYQIMIGSNVNEILLEGEIEKEGTNAVAPYETSKLPHYFAADITEVSDEEYEALYGKKVPNPLWDQTGLLGVNDAICQMYYAKGWLARFVYKILTHLKNKSEAKGVPNLNILFIYNMPFRGLEKMLGGAMDMAMVEALVEMVNGKGFRGFGHLIKAAINKNKK